MSVTNVTCKIGEKEIKFETGKLALQAPGAVVVTSGDTNVLVTTVANESVREGVDFFPLTVDVEVCDPSWATKKDFEISGVA